MGCYVNIYEDDETGELRIEPNPNFIDGRCNFSDTYELTMAHISDPVNWWDIERLYEVVIPDSSFTFTISFPLRNPRSITVQNRDTSSGFTRYDILSIIRSFYTETYRIESDTATQNIIEITTSCDDCDELSVDGSIETVKIETSEDCSICMDLIHNETSKLRCGHIFHHYCIRGWTSTGSTTCPNCRSEIVLCTSCNGRKIVSRQYSAAVPERTSVPFGGRLLTDGEFGVYNYYLEDLALQSLVYNREEQKLNIVVCPMY
jgi:hypothetical protein